METLKAYRNILLGQKIVVHTDHKNLVYKTFNTERVMRWRLLLEEFGPELHYIKGEDNVVADVLSRMDIQEEDFSVDAFAADDGDMSQEYPLSYREIAHEQRRCPNIRAKLADKKSGYREQEFRHSNKL